MNRERARLDAAVAAERARNNARYRAWRDRQASLESDQDRERRERRNAYAREWHARLKEPLAREPRRIVPTRPRCLPCGQRRHGLCEGGTCQCPSPRCQLTLDHMEADRLERAGPSPSRPRPEDTVGSTPREERRGQP